MKSFISRSENPRASPKFTDVSIEDIQKMRETHENDVRNIQNNILNPLKIELEKEKRIILELHNQIETQQQNYVNLQTQYKAAENVISKFTAKENLFKLEIQNQMDSANELKEYYLKEREKMSISIIQPLKDEILEKTTIIATQSQQIDELHLKYVHYYSFFD